MGKASLTMLVAACVCDADSKQKQDLGLMVAQSQMSKAAFSGPGRESWVLVS